MTRTPGPAGARDGIRSDQISGVFLLLLALYVGWQDRAFPVGTLADPGPGFMPLLIAIFLGVVGLLIAVFGGKSEPFSSIPWPEARRAVLVLVISVAGAFALERVGYRLTMIALLVFFLGVVERRHPFAAAAVAVGFSVITYYVFSTLLQVQLPHSPWGF